MKIDAQQAVDALIARGFTPAQAYGIAANFHAESGFDAGINEIKPVVPGSRGGFGLYQLTGPRRRQYESWASENGRELADPDAQLDFMMLELGSTEARAGSLLREAQTAEEAARVFSKAFLRPGHDNTDYRVSVARRMAGGDMSFVGKSGGGKSSGKAPQQPAMGDESEMRGLLAALQAVQQEPQVNPMLQAPTQPAPQAPMLMQRAMAMPSAAPMQQRDYSSELAAFSAQLPWMRYRGTV